ncbi:aminopeptidase P family protein [Glycomyces algeriensis]|uniref:Xaa-Pro aminopeptidase n=1 Tax=Glycomyces algeriensis TaxID=256037 RepID=A0A9W6LHS7_9ACTN|nr:aminopeptidase P family protein [Glycomyces algeriensis]MDA1365489.1 aminopeptidase P family protein [Glycomyces algeriensis]MDR7351175.1 Xaa-Pro aminopeptidase [Glycomyces algeriensis]GLI43888.1 Xaa-Pro aminopeptidase [Glycomyces algeriensis]
MTDARPPYAGTRYPRIKDIKGFTDFIATGWSGEPVPANPVPGAAQAAADHRRRLSERLPGATVVVASGSAPTRNDDNTYLFRPDSDFVWLTGCQAEDAVLVMTPRPGGHDARLHLPPPFRPGETGFFGDANHGELWVGASPGLPEWADALQIDVAPLDRLGDQALKGALTIQSADPALAAAHDLVPSALLDRHLSVLRMVKDAWEIEQMRLAVDATTEGFAAVAREIPRAIGEGLGERWLQGTFDRHARTHGNGTGYTTIVGSGPHAPVLHWVRCDGPVLPDAALLLDMGVEAKSLYTADVTRTLPASGTFSPQQRTVHDLVERAHRAGMAQVRPGTKYLDFHFAAMEVVAQGLHDWGLLPVSVDEALSPRGQQHRRYLACGIGHHLGLDTHDCGHAEYEEYMGADLEPGVVMTVEPGLYFHANDLTVPPELRGIGVRLEDDLLVTEDGAEVLSDALPIDTAGVEAWTQARLKEAA